MTVVVGILCSDGVVIASDSAATFGTGTQQTIGQQEVHKIQRLADSLLFSSTGAVGMSQLLAADIARSWEKNAYHSVCKAPDTLMGAIGNQMGALVRPFLETANLIRALGCGAEQSLCKVMIAAPVEKKPRLFTFDCNGAPEMATRDLPFVCFGCGQPIADPFLAFLKRLLWEKSEPTVSEGRLVAVWAIRHVELTTPGGVGGPIQLATLTLPQGNAPAAAVLLEDAIQEHLEQIEVAEKALIAALRDKGAMAVPRKLPKPPAA